MSSALKTKPAQRQFPLMAWNTETPSDLKLLKRARACGLTGAGFGDSSGLANCHQAGLTLIVQDPVFSHDWSAVTHDWRTFDPPPFAQPSRNGSANSCANPDSGGTT
jgi:hypothetical protein